MSARHIALGACRHIEEDSDYLACHTAVFGALTHGGGMAGAGDGPAAPFSVLNVTPYTVYAVSPTGNSTKVGVNAMVLLTPDYTAPLRLNVYTTQTHPVVLSGPGSTPFVDTSNGVTALTMTLVGSVAVVTAPAFSTGAVLNQTGTVYTPGYQVSSRQLNGAAASVATNTYGPAMASAIVGITIPGYTQSLFGLGPVPAGSSRCIAPPITLPGIANFCLTQSGIIATLATTSLSPPTPPTPSAGTVFNNTGYTIQSRQADGSLLTVAPGATGSAVVPAWVAVMGIPGGQFPLTVTTGNSVCSSWPSYESNPNNVGSFCLSQNGNVAALKVSMLPVVTIISTYNYSVPGTLDGQMNVAVSSWNGTVPGFGVLAGSTNTATYPVSLFRGNVIVLQGGLDSVSACTTCGFNPMLIDFSVPSASVNLVTTSGNGYTFTGNVSVPSANTVALTVSCSGMGPYGTRR